MATVLEQLIEMMPVVGQVGSIVRTPDGFQVNIVQDNGSGHRGVDIRNISISSEYPENISAGTFLGDIPEFSIGWYQDARADLFYYEGKGYWKNAGRVVSEDLTNKFYSGKLEFIG